MTTSDAPPTKTSMATTGRRHNSVTEMMERENVPAEVRTRFNELCEETRMSRTLAKLRVQHGLTQQEMADKLNVSQSAISKLESGRDEDLTLADLRNYSALLDERVGIIYGKPLNSVEAIKVHGLAMKDHMLKLAALASADDQMDKAVQAFFGEAFFNILDILSTCMAKMPHGVEGCELQMEVIPASADASGKPVVPKLRTASRQLVNA